MRAPFCRRRLNGDSDDYKLLGLPARDCQRPPPTPAELKAAFRAKSLKWHPDRNLGCAGRALELLPQDGSQTSAAPAPDAHSSFGS